MGYLHPGPGMVPVAPPPPPNPPRRGVNGVFPGPITYFPASVRGTMTPRGEPDPDGAADYPRFDNEHGAAVREILQTTDDYWAKIDEEYPLLELPPFTTEEI